MSLVEQVEGGIRKYFNIPPQAEIQIEADIAGGSCCHDYPYNEVYISFSYIPDGKKRRVTKQHLYSGTVWDLILEIDNMPDEGRKEIQ